MESVGMRGLGQLLAVVVTAALLFAAAGIQPVAADDGVPEYPGLRITDDDCLFLETAAERGLELGYEDPPTEWIVELSLQIPGFMGSGVAVGDVTGNGYDDLFIASKRYNRLYVNQGDGTFVDRTEEAGLLADELTFDALLVDVTGNGWLDLYVSNVGHNRLYENQGDGTFIDITEEAGVAGPDVPSIQVTAVDVNGSGYLDLYVANFGDYRIRQPAPPELTGEPNLLFINNGDGTFTEAAGEYGIADRHWSIATAWGDVTGNGLPDLFVANDFRDPNQLYINQGDGSFVDVAADTLLTAPNSMNAEFADVTGDGRLDLYVTNIYGEIELWLGNQLHVNLGLDDDGLVLFEDVATPAGVVDTGWGWAGVGFDANLDTYLELYVTNGMVSNPDAPFDFVDVFLRRSTDILAYYWEAVVRYFSFFFEWIASLFTGQERPSWAELRDYLRNELTSGRLAYAGSQANAFFVRDHDASPHPDAHGLAFEDVAEAYCLASTMDGRGVGLADFRGTGSLDLVVNSRQGTFYYDNRWAGSDRLDRSGDNRHLQISLHDPGSPGNRYAVGARIELELDDGRRLLQEVNASNGYISQTSLTRTFGLGGHGWTAVHVVWPHGESETWESADLAVMLDRQGLALGGHPDETPLHISLSRGGGARLLTTPRPSVH